MLRDASVYVGCKKSCERNIFLVLVEILLAWLGNTDIRSSESSDSGERGPILSAVQSMRFDAVHLLSDHPAPKTQAYAKWLATHTGVSIKTHPAKLTSPTEFAEIFRAVDSLIRTIRGESALASLTFHLSPGTPAMAAVWILLAKTKYAARLIESSREHGVKEVSIPFDLSAEFLPASDKQADEELTLLMQGLPPADAAFTRIVHRCNVMKRTVALAHRMALRDVTVLIQGESGTGKELFSRAIHQASVRKGQPFIAVNCGAIPLELVDAELFGHEKGAFTGATTARRGHFESADGGTLFLDEIGEAFAQYLVRAARRSDGENRPHRSIVSCRGWYKCKAETSPA
jgi:sigma54-dependent transcription regulator